MLQRQELINLRRTTTNLMLAGILLAGAGSALAQDGYDWDLAGDSASSVSLAGDVNGDGYSDWVLGDENAVNQFSQATGMIRLVYGAQNGPGSGMADDFRWGSWSGDRFGRSVSLAGDVNGDGYDDIIVGSPGYQYALPDDAGRVSLFLGGPSGLASSPVWTHQGSVNNELLGSYVTALGDVNGDGYDDFAFTYAGWHLQVAYGSSSGQPGSLQSIDAFEYPGSLFNYGPAGDVDGDGYDDLVMGLPYVHNGTYSNGAIGVYLGGSSGLPAQPDQKLYWIRSSDDQLRSDLGSTVTMAGDVDGDGYGDLLVGASGDGTVGAQVVRKGRFLLFKGNSHGFDPTPAWSHWNPGDPSGYDGSYPFYGNHGCTAGDVNGDGFADVLLGSGEDKDHYLQVFLGSPTGLLTEPDATYTTPDFDLTGPLVSCGGDADGDGYGDFLVKTTDAGVLGFAGEGRDLDTQRGWSAIGSGTGWRCGQVVAVLGDVDGDGLDEVALGMPVSGSGDRGEVRVFAGSAGGVGASPVLTIYGQTDGDNFGQAVVRAGDLNGDGYEDMLVGAPGVGGHGAVYAYFGSAAGLSSTPGWVMEGDQSGESFGFAVAGGFDCNADGYTDVLVGSPDYRGDIASMGYCRLYLGGPDGPHDFTSWEYMAEGYKPKTGEVLAAVGDLNRDGYDDVALGLPSYRPGLTSYGRVLVFLGTATGLAEEPSWIRDGQNAFDDYGRSLAAVDLDRNGYSDLVVGIPGYGDAGRVEVFSGPLSAGEYPYFTVSGPSLPGSFGFAMAPAGDVDNDGYGDVIIGDPDANKAHLLLGGGSNVPGAPDCIRLSDWQSTQSGASSGSDDKFGYSVGGGGDVNGDGFADVIVGVPDSDLIYTDRGSAFVYQGNCFLGQTGRYRHLFQAYYTPIPLGGRTNSTALFIQANGLSAQGRCGVQMEIRLAEVAQDPSAGAPRFSGFFDTGLPSGGVSDYGFSELIDGLAPATDYGWEARIHTDSPWFPRSPWFSVDASYPHRRHFSTRGQDQKPDLVVTSADPDSATGGGSTLLTAVVANTGLAAAPGCTARISLDGAVVCASVAVPALAAGAAAEISCDLGRLPCCNPYVEIVLDTGDVVDEMDETNNTFGMNITVTYYYTVHMEADGSGDFPTLQQALDAVNPGGAVVLGDGTYTGGGNRDLELSDKEVTLRSASGNREACVLDAAGTSSAPHRLIRLTGAASLTARDLTFRGGWMGSGGGGVLVIGSTLILDNVAVTGNTGTAGGGLFVQAGSALEATDCLFENNETGDSGGAVGLNASSAEFTACTFRSNHTVWGGGAAYLYGSPADFDVCVFDGNSCDHWGGAIHANGTASAATVSGGTFFGNQADQGSAFYVRNSGHVTADHSLLAFGLGGGAAYCNGGAVELACCDVFDNAGGDYTGCLAGQETENDNFSTDPLFCDAANGLLGLMGESPCAEGVCGLVGALPVGCGVVHVVHPDGSGEFPTIQAAVDGIPDGDIIELADGTFTGPGNHDIGIADRDLTIRSGSGDPAACVVDIQGASSDNHRGFNISGEGRITMRGFTVTGGYSSYGGGILVSGTILVLENMLFQDNHATNGGGVFGISGCEVRATDCLFLANSSSDSGGAVGLNGSHGNFADCRFEGNDGGYAGGGLYLYSSSADFFRDLFLDNVGSGLGGAIHANQSDSSCSLSYSTFHGNTASAGNHLYVRNGGSFNTAFCILATDDGGDAAVCNGGVIDLYCCDVFGGNGFSDCLAQYDGSLGNFSADPLFCDPAAGDLTLQAGSPCLENVNSCGATIGALDEGCAGASPVAEDQQLPQRSFLAANAPNPFNPRTVIRFGLEAPATTTLVIYDLSGRKVRTLAAREPLTAGVHEYVWNGQDDNGRTAAAGTYLYRVQAGKFTATRKMTLLK